MFQCSWMLMDTRTMEHNVGREEEERSVSNNVDELGGWDVTRESQTREINTNTAWSQSRTEPEKVNLVEPKTRLMVPRGGSS